MTYGCKVVRDMCSNKANADFRSEKETNGWIRSSDGKKAARVTIPKGRSPLADGTLRSIIRQLLLNKEQFVRFMNCTMSSEEYFRIVDAQKMSS